MILQAVNNFTIQMVQSSYLEKHCSSPSPSFGQVAHEGKELVEGHTIVKRQEGTALVPALPKADLNQNGPKPNRKPLALTLPLPPLAFCPRPLTPTLLLLSPYYGPRCVCYTDYSSNPRAWHSAWHTIGIKYSYRMNNPYFFQKYFYGFSCSSPSRSAVRNNYFR